MPNRTATGMSSPWNHAQQVWNSLPVGEQSGALGIRSGNMQVSWTREVMELAGFIIEDVIKKEKIWK